MNKDMKAAVLLCAAVVIGTVSWTWGKGNKKSSAAKKADDAAIHIFGIARGEEAASAKLSNSSTKKPVITPSTKAVPTLKRRFWYRLKRERLPISQPSLSRV